MNTINQLLREVSFEIEINNKIIAEQRCRGEHFSIFETLGVWSDEMKHSAVLAQFLNPKANHGMGDAFLRCFLDHVGISNLNLNTAHCIVAIEQAFDNGRLDIVITDEAKAVIIENKIYAGDQNAQLIRYNEYAKDNYKDGYRIVYLTLDGHEATNGSVGEGNDRVKYFSISYRDTILKWLSRCTELAFRAPLVRETLIQYHNLIKKLTNTDVESEIKDKIIDLMTTSDMYVAAVEISDNVKKIKEEICKQGSDAELSEELSLYNNEESRKIEALLYEVKDRILKEYFEIYLSEMLKEMNCSLVKFGDNNHLTTPWWGFVIEPCEWKNFRIHFEFGTKGAKNLYYGILSKNIENRNESIIVALHQMKSLNPNEYWHFRKNMLKFRNWSNKDYELMYTRNSSLYTEISNCVKTLLDKTKSLQM